MFETIVVCIAAVFVIMSVLFRDSLEMPLSWDDDKEEYIRCYNCDSYIRQNQGYAASCPKCPFYRESVEKEKEDNDGDNNRV